MKIKDITLIAIFASLLSIISPIAFPIGTVPITFSIFLIYIIGALFSPVKAFLTILVYIFLGIIGVPVFSGYSSGVGVLIGPTGGFITGYILCAVIIGLLLKINKSKAMYVISMILGTVACYMIGILQYSFVMNTNIMEALIICIVPFIIFDIIKIIFIPRIFVNNKR